jgi:SAM-dependent methyltransferase
MGEQYSALGSYFEYLNKDCDYEKWSQYIIQKLALLHVGNTGLDIGCGNGTFTRALYKAGYAISGVDISPAMLTKARELATKNGVRTEFLQGDITKLKVSAKVDFAIAVNDCLNYVAPEKIPAAFAHVAGCLKKGGAFLFDVSSDYKLKNVLGNNLFAEDRDELTYLWFNTLQQNCVEMDLTFFIPQKDGTYRRADEHHVQYIHTQEFLTEKLSEAGFEVLATEGHLGADILAEEAPLRYNFICRKV